jgi:hypothetical protein
MLLAGTANCTSLVGNLHMMHLLNEKLRIAQLHTQCILQTLLMKNRILLNRDCMMCFLDLAEKSPQNMQSSWLLPKTADASPMGTLYKKTRARLPGKCQMDIQSILLDCSMQTSLQDSRGNISKQCP